MSERLRLLRDVSPGIVFCGFLWIAFAYAVLM